MVAKEGQGWQVAVRSAAVVDPEALGDLLAAQWAGAQRLAALLAAADVATGEEDHLGLRREQHQWPDCSLLPEGVATSQPQPHARKYENLVRPASLWIAIAFKHLQSNSPFLQWMLGQMPCAELPLLPKCWVLGVYHLAYL